jgi:tetratricopeptide (TPR) repeat protein
VCGSFINLHGLALFCRALPSIEFAIAIAAGSPELREALAKDAQRAAFSIAASLPRDRSQGIPDATIQRWINILVAIDRNLAQTAIAEASVPGVSPRKIANVMEELAKGNADGSRGDYDKAIEHYERAWKEVRGCKDDEDDD